VVTGLDFSRPALNFAQRLAAEMGLQANFVHGTVDEAPRVAPGPFDLVFATWGALCWQPNLGAWGRVIASVLAPGGELYCADAHPGFLVLPDRPMKFSGPTVMKHRSPGVSIHSLSAIIGAVIEAGLILTNFREHEVLPWRRYAARVATRPGEAIALSGDVVNLISAPDRMWRLRDDQPPIPLSFSIRARKQWSQVARTQQPKIPEIGFLHIQSPVGTAAMLAAFRDGLRQSGYVEGQNLAAQYRWADDQYDRLPALAEDLVRRRVTVIVTAGSTAASLAAKAATATIPIVFTTAADPVQIGLVASISRPGGNATGVSSMNRELTAQCLELLHDLMPQATRFAMLHNPISAIGQFLVTNAQTAARALGVEILVVNTSSENNFEQAFETLVQQRIAALYVDSNPLFVSNHHQIVALAARHQVPTVYQNNEAVAAGGLMSYGPHRTDLYRLAGAFTGRILNGERPADLPVHQMTKFDLVINLKTAKVLGLTIPQILLSRADEVIE
jgi:putative ABC transport system substrate-binding protein